METVLASGVASSLDPVKLVLTAAIGYSLHTGKGILTVASTLALALYLGSAAYGSGMPVTQITIHVVSVGVLIAIFYAVSRLLGSIWTLVAASVLTIASSTMLAYAIANTAATAFVSGPVAQSENTRMALDFEQATTEPAPLPRGTPIYSRYGEIFTREQVIENIQDR